MNHRIRPLLLAAALVAAVPPFASQPPAKETPKAPSIQLRIQAETVHLPNGMTFILAPRPGAPTFAGYVAFKVGGVDSVPGDTGLAHMFEHMAFKGTEHVGTKDWAHEKVILEELQAAGDKLTMMKAEGSGTPEEVKALEEKVKDLSKQEKAFIVKDEFDLFYTRAGQRALNANTGEDVTQYFVSLPTNSLELWMLLESQRIREPIMREFYSERDVIGQERLMRTENDPFGKLYEQFEATAFMAHPYRLPAIGWQSDIKALRMKQAQDFFYAHYSPSNAVAVLVGNFDTARAKVLIDKYFATIPRRGDPPPIVTREPVQERERRVQVVFDANPQMLVGWHKPTWPSLDDTRLDVVSTILSDGVTSRLYKRLVEKDHLALDVSTWNGDPGARCDNLFVAQVTPNEGVPYATVEAALYDEIDKLKTDPVSAAEMDKAKTRILASYLRRLDSTLSTAMLLGSQHLITGDWQTIYKYIDDVQKVSAEDVRTAVKTYLSADNRTVATLVKPAQPVTEKKEATP